MDLTLRGGLYHQEVNGAHILFDLPADRYLLLTGSTAACFERFLSGRATESDRAQLVDRDLIGPGGSNAAFSEQCFTPPAASLFDDGLPEGDLRGTLVGLWLLHHARSSLRRRPLADVLESLARLRPARMDTNKGISVRIAADLRRAGRFIPMQDPGLARGVAMMGALYRKGVAASLVFGVTMPFAAHCWVQVGDLVLTDSFDIVRNYQPIYVL